MNESSSNDWLTDTDTVPEFLPTLDEWLYCGREHEFKIPTRPFKLTLILSSFSLSYSYQVCQACRILIQYCSQSHTVCSMYCYIPLHSCPINNNILLTNIWSEYKKAAGMRILWKAAPERLRVGRLGMLRLHYTLDM